MRGGGARTEVQHQGQSGELVARSGQRIEPQDQGRQVLASGGDATGRRQAGTEMMQPWGTRRLTSIGQRWTATGSAKL